MLARHKKARSDMKSAAKKLKDARIKYAKTKQATAKAQQRVAMPSPSGHGAGTLGILTIARLFTVPK